MYGKKPSGKAMPKASKMSEKAVSPKAMAFQKMIAKKTGKKK
jgi:hypothetical protein